MTREKELEVLEGCRKRFTGYLFREVEVEKNNHQVLRGIRVGKLGDVLGIAVYWEDMECILGCDFHMDTAMDYIQTLIQTYLDRDMDYHSVFCWEAMKGRIRKKLVNYRRNKAHLEHVVHRRYLDLAEVCYLILDVPVGHGNTDLQKALLEKWEVTEEEVFRQAEKNMELEGYQVDQLAKYLGGDGCVFPELNEMPPLLVGTNKAITYGAAIMTSPEILKRFLKNECKNYYILPSSTHEVIFRVDCGMDNPEELRKMVWEINRIAVSEKDYLSDSVYYYHGDTGEVTLCER